MTTSEIITKYIGVDIGERIEELEAEFEELTTAARKAYVDYADAVNFSPREDEIAQLERESADADDAVTTFASGDRGQELKELMALRALSEKDKQHTQPQKEEDMDKTEQPTTIPSATPRIDPPYDLYAVDVVAHPANIPTEWCYRLELAHMLALDRAAGFRGCSVHVTGFKAPSGEFGRLLTSVGHQYPHIKPYLIEGWVLTIVQLPEGEIEL